MMTSGCLLFRFLVLLLTYLISWDSTAASKTNATASDDGFGREEQIRQLSGLEHVPTLGHDGTQAKNALIATDSLLFASTLDGTLFAVSKTNGKIIWSMKEDPVLNIPGPTDNGLVFFANPKDGSLYSYRVGLEGLKELSFTIPDLVSLSPCKSTDGLLYTGSKTDTWFAVDPLTGVKIQTLNMDGAQQICPSSSVPTIFIGRTEYKVVMFDRETRQPRWNATFLDYSSHAAPNVKDYEFQHFASSSGGVIVTMDRENGEVLWSSDFMSPVVAIYTLNQDQGFQKVPFVTFAKETLLHLTGRMTSTEWRSRFLEHGKQETVFYQTLFIGEHDSHLYALPSLVDVNSVSITPKNFGRLLLEGPVPDSVVVVDDDVQDELILSTSGVGDNNLILLGYHEVPDVSPGKLYHPPVHLIADKSSLVIPVFKNETIKNGVVRPHVLPDGHFPYNATHSEEFSVGNSHHVDAKFVTAVIIGFILASAFIFSVFKSRVDVEKVLIKSVAEDVNSLQQEITDGICTVGKITFNPEDVLGHGCGGTEVFRGRFDGRDVAVKRLLPHFFNLADREADLLRESDQHQNVIRYYCTERDIHFRYIAFELCTATVYDYVENKEFDRGCIATKTLLQQMMSGISHLHSLSIVHRDIKPQNVLLSQPDAYGQARAMISDFGLCKKLSSGRQSLSKVSGTMGTFGWIAPEMINPQHKITRAVDIFSAGCVIFYVLSNGEHPFGGPLHRQANISNGKYDLSYFSKKESESNLARNLVEKMVEHSPSNRPNPGNVLKHPFFWSTDQQLRFLEVVSNRLEKVSETEPIVVRLEAGGLHVIKSNWSFYITEDLKNDLRKFRTYKYFTVRDLLRAIRNKHHHFAELTKELQTSLGQTPDEYVRYFTSRFPALVLHVYDAMSCFTSEPSLAPFY